MYTISLCPSTLPRRSQYTTICAVIGDSASTYSGTSDPPSCVLIMSARSALERNLERSSVLPTHSVLLLVDLRRMSLTLFSTNHYLLDGRYNRYNMWRVGKSQESMFRSLECKPRRLIGSLLLISPTYTSHIYILSQSSSVISSPNTSLLNLLDIKTVKFGHSFLRFAFMIFSMSTPGLCTGFPAPGLRTPLRYISEHIAQARLCL